MNQSLQSLEYKLSLYHDSQIKVYKFENISQILDQLANVKGQLLYEFLQSKFKRLESNDGKYYEISIICSRYFKNTPDNVFLDYRVPVLNYDDNNVSWGKGDDKNLIIRFFTWEKVKGDLIMTGQSGQA
jgi:hypothetical protein